MPPVMRVSFCSSSSGWMFVDIATGWYEDQRFRPSAGGLAHVRYLL